MLEKLLANSNIPSEYHEEISSLLRQNCSAASCNNIFKKVFDQSADGIIVADIESKKFDYANPAICDMLGYDAKEFSTLGVKDIHPKKDMIEVMSAFNRCAKGEIGLAPNLPCITKKGTVIYCDITANPFEMNGKKYLNAFFRDVTEQKKLQKLISEVNANEISQLIISGFFHDFNNVYAVMQGYHELLT